MKQFLLIATLFSFQVSWGQNDYRPIPETNAAWIQADFLYSAYNGHEHATVTSVVYTLNDTLINGIPYCKFGQHAIADWIDNFGSQQNQTSGTDYIPFSEGYFRQDTLLKKVFIWNPFTQMDDLLYDFGSLVVGQPYPATITNINYPNLLVMAVDSVELLDGISYKRWVLGTNSSDSAYVSVIEGVGGTNGFNTMIHPVFEQSSNLLCHKKDLQPKYENWITNFLSPRYSEDCSNTLAIDHQNEMNIEVYPNPSEDFVTVRANQIIKTIEIFNLNGQLLFQQENFLGQKELILNLSKLNGGMYILKMQLADDTNITEQVQLMK